MRKSMLCSLLCLITLVILFHSGALATASEARDRVDETILDLQVIDFAALTIDENKIALAHACNTNYGYQDLVIHVGHPDMILLYEKIDTIYEAFFASSADASQIYGNYTAGALTVEENLLTEDQILQTWTVYRMDHPAYYWIP